METTVIRNNIEQIRNIRAFDPTAYADALLGRALEVYKSGKDTEDTQRASRIAEIEGKKFIDVLKNLIDAKVADKVQRQAGKEIPYVQAVESQRESILKEAADALKRFGLVWEAGRKSKAVKDEYTDIVQACTVIETLETMELLPEEVTLYSFRIGLGNSIYKKSEDQ